MRKWTTEMGWAIELTIMYDRWCKLRGYPVPPGFEPYDKHLWVSMCMRLGDEQALKLQKKRIAEFKGLITDGEYNRR